MAVSGVLSGLRFGSPLAVQYKSFVLELIRNDHELDPDSVLSNVAPFVFRELEETERFQRARDRCMARADGAYLEWLERLV